MKKVSKEIIGICIAIIFLSSVFIAFAGSQPAIKSEYNIAFIVKAHGVPWYIALESAVVDEFKKIAEENKVAINVTTQQCNYSGELLAQYMRTARMMKVDAMIIMAPDAFSGIPEVIEANKANIPIFTVMEKILGGDI